MEKEEGHLCAKDYIDFQNKRWYHRRVMTYMTLLFYFVISILMIVYIPTAHFEAYLGYYIQVALFCGTVIVAYFSSNTFENVKSVPDQMIAEYEKLHDITRNVNAKNKELKG